MQECFEENRIDVDRISDAELKEYIEVFPLPGGGYLIVEGETVYMDIEAVIIKDCLYAMELFMEEVFPQSREEKYYDYPDLKETDEAAEEYLMAADIEYTQSYKGAPSGYTLCPEKTDKVKERILIWTNLF